MYKKFIRLAAVLIAVAISQGCATLLSGSDDTVTVDVPNCQQATCFAANGKGQYPMTAVPGPVLVQKDSSALTVTCEAEGAEPVSAQLRSGTDGWVWGNILIGGLIGLVVDATTGSIHNYDESVVVPLACGADEPATAEVDAEKEVSATQG